MEVKSDWHKSDWHRNFARFEENFETLDVFGLIFTRHISGVWLIFSWVCFLPRMQPTFVCKCLLLKKKLGKFILGDLHFTVKSGKTFFPPRRKRCVPYCLFVSPLLTKGFL
ncbi:hypothetical protein HAX54_046302 [Datura stramonium]|uniref:Uncharacterized protein n=1 Tax=Datura stramonium TaxID=4076 RepID=A0ABS8SRX2_DATST|nr:hypothetical protein [Datura stramonium]